MMELDSACSYRITSVGVKGSMRYQLGRRYGNQYSSAGPRGEAVSRVRQPAAPEVAHARTRHSRLERSRGAQHTGFRRRLPEPATLELGPLQPGTPIATASSSSSPPRNGMTRIKPEPQPIQRPRGNLGHAADHRRGSAAAWGPISKTIPVLYPFSYVYVGRARAGDAARRHAPRLRASFPGGGLEPCRREPAGQPVVEDRTPNMQALCLCTR